MHKAFIAIFLSITVSQTFATPAIPNPVLKFMQEQVRKQCPMLPKNVSLQTHRKEKTSDGWIYSADFTGADDNYLIVVESEQGLALEDIHCPGDPSPLVAF